MKPVVLELQAFMPYAAKEVVDFRELGPQRLMMISGETGSGKTAVLDAMAYALFGASTGGGRNENSYRSDHAVEGTQTYVNFQFDVQGGTYRVIRYPKQAGKSQGHYELWRLDGSDEELVTNGKTKVNDAVHSLLRYNLKQFRSVVVLPQGQFRDFLAAKTDDKAKILSALLGTDRYRALQDELYTRFSRLKDEQKDTRKQIDGILERQSVGSAAELADVIEALKKRIETMSAEVKAAAEVSAQTLTAHNAAVALVKKFDQRASTTKLIAEHEAKQDERTKDEAKLKRAGQAALASPLEQALTERQAELTAAQEREASSNKLLEAAKGAKKQSEAELAKQDGRADERESSQTQLLKLDALAKLVKELQALVAERETTVADLADKKAAHDAATTSLEELAATLLTLAETLKTQQLAAANLDAAQVLHDASAKRLEQRKTLATSVVKLKKAEGLLVTRTEEAQSAAKLSVEAKAKFDATYQAHLSDYAAQLAKGLEAGSACRVCGSADHPKPASASEGAPDKEAVDAARAQLQDAEKAEKAAHSATRKAQKAVEPLRAQVGPLREELGEDASSELEDLERQLKESAAGLQVAKDAKKNLAQTESKIEKGKSRQTSLSAEAKTSAEAHSKAERSAQANKTLLDAKQETIPEELRAAGALDKQVLALRKKLATMVEELEQARAALKTQGEALVAATTEEANAKRAAKDASKKAATALSTFDASVSGAGFADADDYRTAKLDDESCTQLDQKIKSYDQTLSELRGRLKQLVSETEELERPDPEATQTALTTAKAKESAGREKLTEEQKAMSPKEKGLESIANLKAESAEREAAFGLMGTLAKTAQGNNEHRLKFERYVLAGLLDEVLVLASQRLKKMSNSRYTLHRTEPTQNKNGKVKIDKRSQAGLDLEVLDAHTGKRRDASSLSGGEGFQASLSLALGLADVIQTQAGGIELGAMFIDEGFGTQSSEALDSVLDTLVSLQSSGRLIGFISHVDGMKERISAQLVVTKTPTGSHMKFEIS